MHDSHTAPSDSHVKYGYPPACSEGVKELCSKATKKSSMASDPHSIVLGSADGTITGRSEAGSEIGIG